MDSLDEFVGEISRYGVELTQRLLAILRSDDPHAHDLCVHARVVFSDRDTPLSERMARVENICNRFDQGLHKDIKLFDAEILQFVPSVIPRVSNPQTTGEVHELRARERSGRN